MTLAYAAHRLNGIATPANAAYSGPELKFQLKSSGAKCLFTCLPLLDIALEAAGQAGIPKERVFILEMAKSFTGIAKSPFKTLSQLVEEGRNIPKIENLKWSKGQGGKQTAYLCYSSGTSGLPVSCYLGNLGCNLLTAFTERSHDIPPQCDFKYYANKRL